MLSTFGNSPNLPPNYYHSPYSKDTYTEIPPLGHQEETVNALHKRIGEVRNHDMVDIFDLIKEINTLAWTFTTRVQAISDIGEDIMWRNNIQVDHPLHFHRMPTSAGTVLPKIVALREKYRVILQQNGEDIWDKKHDHLIHQIDSISHEFSIIEKNKNVWKNIELDYITSLVQEWKNMHSEKMQYHESKMAAMKKQGIWNADGTYSVSQEKKYRRDSFQYRGQLYDTYQVIGRDLAHQYADSMNELIKNYYQDEVHNIMTANFEGIPSR